MPGRRLPALAARAALAAALAGAPLLAQPPAPTGPPPLLPAAVVRALAGEVSGTAARRTVQELTLHHRMRGSRGFHAAVLAVRDRLRDGGLASVEVLSFPADGKVFYGTQRSRPAWDADFAELWEEEKAGDGWADARRVASWEARPVTLAQDSASGEVAADLVDAGAGTAEKDYAWRDVRGKLVLVAAQPGAVYPLAVGKLGAAGIVSYAQNQVTAWWKDDDSLVRWGHLPTFPPPKTFAFMVSRLRASVRAGQHPGSYEIATAVLPGADPAVREQEIVLSCHLDHLRPGANDNASGCATILEVARALARLVREKRLPPPRRTIRFVFPPEVEGTIVLLNARPDLAARAKAVIHMDMVGGDAEITKAVFHVTRSPASLPTFVNDVGAAFGRFVNEQSYAFAATGDAPFPLVDPEGGKRALQAEFVDFTEGSDHQVWSEGSWRVPAIYLNDWPDRYIHTHADEVAHIDATKLLRAAFLGAASAYYLADLRAGGVPALWEVVRRGSLSRAAEALARADRLRQDGQPAEADNLLRFARDYERGVVASIGAFAAPPAVVRLAAEEHSALLARLLREGGAPAPPAGSGAAEADRVYRRAAVPKGPMTGFGYGYLDDKLAEKKIAAPALPAFQGIWGGGAEYAYEALNLVDGRRTVRQVRDDLAAIYGPVPLATVAEFLTALERIGVVTPVPPSPRGSAVP